MCVQATAHLFAGMVKETIPQCCRHAGAKHGADEGLLKAIVLRVDCFSIIISLVTEQVLTPDELLRVVTLLQRVMSQPCVQVFVTSVRKQAAQDFCAPQDDAADWTCWKRQAASGSWETWRAPSTNCDLVHWLVTFLHDDTRACAFGACEL